MVQPRQMRREPEEVGEFVKDILLILYSFKLFLLLYIFYLECKA